ncbi:MAG: tyrosine-type recombinase/integrase, partial [Clostridia bacterium]
NCVNYIDFESTTPTKTRREISTTKTQSSSRVIPFISDKLEILLKDQIAINKANKMLYGRCYKKTELLFPSEKGQLIIASSISSCFIRLCDLIEKNYNKGISPKSAKYVKLFGKVNAHMLRHSFATRCLEAGMNIKVVSKLLGHSKIQITLDTYSHVLEQFQDEEVAKVTDYFKEKELF